jgi:hypothetical protein
VNLSGNLGLLGYLAVLLLALNEWAFVLLYVYCLKRFRKNFRVKLITAILALFAMLGAVVAQRRLYQPVSADRLSVNEFDVVAIAENAIALFILLYSLRNCWRNWDLGKGVHDS